MQEDSNDRKEHRLEEDRPKAWMMKNLLLLAPTLVWFRVAS
jgi:hypothetical protein